MPIHGTRIELSDTALAEASGLQQSGSHPARFWAVNDSGNAAEIMRLDMSPDRSNAQVRRFALPTLINHDWEDLSFRPGPNAAQLIIADIGDNRAKREKVFLHYLSVSDDAGPQHIRSQTLRYPDGPRDAEGLAWDNRHQRLVLLSKRDDPPGLYVLQDDQLMQDEAQLAFLGQLPDLPWPQGLDPRRVRAGSLRPTALDISTDGRHWAVLTYIAAYIFEAPEEPNSGLKAPIRTLPLADLAQAEGLSFDGADLLVISEQLPTRLARLSWQE